MGKQIDTIIRQHLVRDIRTGTEYDNQDTPISFPPARRWDGREFTECNQKALRDVFRSRDVQTIVEIGVARLSTNRYEHTSTSVFLQEKSESCIYVGIDIEDRTFLHSKRPNVHTIKANSADVDAVFPQLKALGIDKIDFLFIDGWHSINQVLKEWQYTDLLSAHAVVGLHDTNHHPGPSELVKSLNSKWRVECLCPDDWGIAFCYAGN